MAELYTMKHACDYSGLAYETLKFYCNQGLVPNMKRDKNNRRIFDEKDLRWIKDLSCLKRCNMSIEEMKYYLELCLQGPSSITERKKMLATKRNELLQQIDELNTSIEYIDWKQELYDDFQSGKKPYISNLVP
ncbi:MerR family transcriptional regulator [Veillonella sp. R32]|uniref:MerR family transcriptional regulator n=1 Tax=Veillonella sp. R32 TaxID=2021312 RepID=UPI00192EB365|nr:MerR family transcriptional regulator [Veillonella sp. R32]